MKRDDSFRDVVLDLETMGTSPCAAIVSIGAVLLDHEKWGVREVSLDTGYRHFCRNVDLATSIEKGGEVDGSTVTWWLQQSEGARKALLDPTPIPIDQALEQFRDWLKWFCGDRRVRVWGNGAAFDNVILRSAYDRSDIACPWSYKDDRCYRTLRQLFPTVPEPIPLPTASMIVHRALDDAHAEALHLVELLRRATGRKRP